ncbi:SDR family NAD(P)-dependent oxidoreductase [Nocardioides sp. zg-579]|uniref:SDR family NAD(P)-dependent oxidoreductase n=1 Tax=Nocardioides marmotae TaxID=2663857 RepID=A0A6I3JFY0_9ACTN|nr:SDR family NAD(P)-dependent oxidoreductase [Nocardioides marmotae]MCR6033288.1 SDR family NAD(P)-dependent oxidoreductase [Gordonia jinghuaiqii]MTB96945.1 SDR family NAD(P)-dependent oxidoreductase [Nocardioides marmotae]QKE00672.1 SDR family NAD(P)-dependent oxidoreductase [Nocardioides marmotae]
MDATTDTTQQAGLALVTGASTGIGRSVAHELARRGYDVVLAADEPEIHAAAAEVASAHGVDARPVQVDLTRPEEVEHLWREASGSGRPVDVVVLNAGVGVGGTFADTALERHLRLVDLNVRSTVHLAKLAVDDMVRRGAGRILVTASIAAVAPNPFQATYAASKAFVHSFAEGIRHELQDTGVTVTSLMPGPTDTEFFRRADLLDTALGQGPKDDPDEVARDGLDALFAGKPHVVAGSFKNRALAELATHLPDRLTTKAMAAQTRKKDD